MTLRNMPPEDERRALADQLWTYGEDELAPRAFDLTDEQLERLGEVAWERMITTETPSGGPIFLAMASALAAVEILEAVRVRWRDSDADRSRRVRTPKGALDRLR